MPTPRPDSSNRSKRYDPMETIARRAEALADLLRASDRRGEALVASNIAEALRGLSLRRVA
jgi:hypothetical protein